MLLSAVISYFPVLPRTGQIVDRLYGVALASVSNSFSHSIPLELAEKGNPREFINAEGGALTQRTRGDAFEVAEEAVEEAPKESEGSQEETPVVTEEGTMENASKNKTSPVSGEALPLPPKSGLYGEPKRIDGSSGIPIGRTNVLIDNEAILETSSAMSASMVDFDIETTASGENATKVVGSMAAKECPFKENEPSTTTTLAPVSKCPESENKTVTEAPTTTTVTVSTTQTMPTTQTSTVDMCQSCIENFLKKNEKSTTTTIKLQMTQPNVITTGTAIPPSENPYEDGETIRRNRNGTVQSDSSLEKDDTAGLREDDGSVKGPVDYPNNDEEYNDEDPKDIHSLLDSINARFRSLFNALKSQLDRYRHSGDNGKFGNSTQVSPSRKKHEATLQKILGSTIPRD
uniref:Uncharacterized protein n=1 Tax=Steinernema glaseri TaxID=37863 RepID=A0A1I8ADH1_9BILA